MIYQHIGQLRKNFANLRGKRFVEEGGGHSFTSGFAGCFYLYGLPV